MDLTVFDKEGKETKNTISLDSSVFAIEPNDHVIWLDVRRIQAHQRQGTHKTKERSDVRGSGRKLYRQKGTGNARAGDAKSPIRKTGGRAHGPRPRDYKLDLNNKTKQLARRSALSYKDTDEEIRVVEDFRFDAPDTHQVVEMLTNLELEGKKVLFLTSENDLNFYRSSKNIQKLEVKEGRNVHTVDILNADVIVFQQGALEKLTEILSTDQKAVA